MMDYEFGDILDARNVPEIKHFILVVGEIDDKGKKKIMYYIISSRVYAVFSSVIEYFNDCMRRKDKEFFKFFGKEKEKAEKGIAIKAKGLISQTIFLDKDTNYSSCLDTESMIVINNNPQYTDKDVIEKLKTDGKIFYKTKLTKRDAFHLFLTIRYSKDVSEFRRGEIYKSFEKIKSSLS